MIPAAHSSVQYMHCHGFKGLLFTVIDATVACVDICEVLPILYYVTCDFCVYECS